MSNPENVVTLAIERKERPTHMKSVMGERTTPLRRRAKEKYFNGSASLKKDRKGRISRITCLVTDKTLGVVLRNTQCRINPDMKLLEGDTVTIEKYLSDLNLYQIRFNNKSGLYAKRDIMISNKKGQELKHSI